MKKLILLTSAIVAFTAQSFAQEKPRQDIYSPVFALKTNALYLATTTFNLGVEFALGNRTTLDISGNYNPWKFKNNRDIRHWMVQPELRFWTKDRFNGHFFGLHGIYADYKVGGWPIDGDENFLWFDVPNLRNNRYEGKAYGGGISYGYQWILSNRFNLEATIGAGYMRLDYDTYARGTDNKTSSDQKRDYFGPTKVGLTFVYIIK